MGLPLSRSLQCFVIQPFGLKPHPETAEAIDNDRVFEALRRVRKTRPELAVEVYRAATQCSDERLHQHLLECISRADFCIADITGLNPNVIYEAGLARGMGRRLILIRQDRTDLPADLRGLITVSYSMDALPDLDQAIAPHLDSIEPAFTNV